jgi:hypothetical protein
MNNYHEATNQDELDSQLADLAQLELAQQEGALGQDEAEAERTALVEDVADTVFPN